MKNINLGTTYMYPKLTLKIFKMYPNESVTIN